jgi:hypothetical protein
MNNLTKEEIEAKKKEIFDAMGQRSQRNILKKGYDNWNPFEEPKDPLYIRRDVTKRTVQDLVREFMHIHREEKSSVIYAEGVLEMAMALMNNNDKYRGMFEYALWYSELLKKEGYELGK